MRNSNLQKDKSRISTSRISTDILELKQEFDAFEGADFESSNDSLILDESGEKVLVKITSGRVDGLISGAKGLGFDVQGSRSDLNFVEGFIPIKRLNNSLNALINNGLLLGVVPVYKPITNAGSATSQADFIHEADRVRASLPTGHNGTGVNVGVLSDSYNNLGGATGDVASGDLPAVVNVLEDLGSGGSDEGRAMLQLIHDLAPGADLSFATAFGGQTNFANNIQALATDGADIIVDDVIYPDEPFFQDGVVALAVDDVVTNNGVAYFSAAGNNADKSYESNNFNGTADPTLDNIISSSGFTLPSGGYIYHDFDPTTGNVDTRQQLTLNHGQSIWLALQWDDPFYTSNGVDTDLDIFLIDSSNSVVKFSNLNNISAQYPFEYVAFQNTSGSQQTYDVVIATTAGPDPGRIKYVDFGTGVTPEYDTNSSTIYGHASAINAEAVGAVPYFNQENPESFTSLGPTTILFESDGTLKATPEIRQKPDLVAIDGTDTTFFGSSDFDSTGFPNFFGTSAAAPHAAAIAALLKEADSSLTPAQIYDRLETTAKDIYSSGFDNLTGAGLINAYDAIFGIAKPTALNFTDNFEDGDLPIAYKTNSTGGGRIEVANGELILDNSFAANLSSSLSPDLNDPNDVNLSLNEVILQIDTTGYSDVQLSFAQREFNDNDHAMSASFIGSENSDGVAFSIDGNTWHRLASLTGGNSTNSYQSKFYNLSAQAAEKGLTLGSNVQIKFQQYGLFSIASDGFAFDNISVTGTLTGTITGSDSDDTLSGGTDNDTISAGNGNDIISAGAGDDNVIGYFGKDRLNGESGNDTLDGGDGDDLIQGGSENDTIFGSAGNDFLLGDEGNDSLSGGPGADVLIGGASDDLLDGGAESDRLLGFDGADIFVLTPSDTGNIIYDFELDIDLLGVNPASFGASTVAEVYNNSLSFSQNGTSTEINSGTDLLATLYNVNLDNLTVDDFTPI